MAKNTKEKEKKCGCCGQAATKLNVCSDCDQGVCEKCMPDPKNDVCLDCLDEDTYEDEDDDEEDYDDDDDDIFNDDDDDCDDDEDDDLNDDNPNERN